MPLGIKCKLYYNSNTYNSPTWVEIKGVGDFSLNRGWGGNPFATREHRVMVDAKTVLTLELSGKLRVNYADTAYVAVANAMDADTVLDVLVLTGPHDSGDARGYRFDAQVHQANQDQGTGVSAVMDDIVVKPTPSTNNPKKAIVTSGVIAFSDIAA